MGSSEGGRWGMDKDGPVFRDQHNASRAIEHVTVKGDVLEEEEEDYWRWRRDLFEPHRGDG